LFSFVVLQSFSLQGGNGLPFFFTKIDGAQGDAKKPDVAKQAYKLHTKVGWYFEMLVLLHISAVPLHFMKVC
jgi:cytochrome b561